MNLNLNKCMRNEIIIKINVNHSVFISGWGSTVMLKTVGADGAAGYGRGACVRVQAFQQQNRMARQRMVPPIMAPGEVKIQWLRIPA